jgi:hypothetical protein
VYPGCGAWDCVVLLVSISEPGFDRVLDPALPGVGAPRLVEFVSVAVASDGKLVDRGVRLIELLLVSAMDVSLVAELPLPY